MLWLFPAVEIATVMTVSVYISRCQKGKVLLTFESLNCLVATGIRTCLLESEEHVCPTCKQSDVSPDALIANKFLRQVRNRYFN